MRKLNWGCGPCTASGWINADLKDIAGVDLRCDIRTGLPFDAGSIDCIASIHMLQDLPYEDLAPALGELRRVLKPGGVLRIAVPDLDKALQAYLAGDPTYFYVPDSDARSIGAKLITQITWYGSVRTPFTFDFLHESLTNAGFHAIERCDYGLTRSSYPDLPSLDNRARESLFVEAAR